MKTIFNNLKEHEMALPEEIKDAYEELVKQPKKSGIRYLLETGDNRRDTQAFRKFDT